MLAIYKRELKSYFRSFIGFLFVGVVLFFMGLYFTVYNMMYGYPYYAYVVSGALIILLIAIPVLTMRSLAEEKRSKTDQLILTAPVSVGSIVIGKFLALLTVFAIPVAISCVYPLIMSAFGSIPMGEAYLAILAFFLFGMTALALGLFVSSLTESQVIAAVLGFLILFLGYMMTSITNMISSTGNWLTKILNCFDLYTPFANLLSGTLNVGSIIYFVSVTMLVLFLTTQAIQKRRYSVSVKNFSVGAYSTGMIAVAVAIVVVVNIVIGEMPVTWTSIDLTSEKLYSLTDQTKDYVETIDEDVVIYVLAKEDNQDTTLGQTLQRYDDLSDHITVEYVDPTVNPMFITKYTSSSVNTNSLIVVSEKRSKVIDYSSIYESSFDYQTYTSTTTGYDGEGQITSALDYVLSDDMPKAYMTTGHGEASFESGFTTALERENVEYESINLMDYDAVPEDAACLIINGASGDFSTDDKAKVLSYLENGGKVIMITTITTEETPNLDAIMEYMGIQVADGLVMEENENNYYGVPYYLLPEVTSSEYTTGIYGKYHIFAPLAQGMVIENEAAADMEYVTFLSTSEDAFSKVDISNLDNFDKAEGDIDGPFAIGIASEKTLEDTKATLVAISCDQMFTTNANSMVSGANQKLFVNTVSRFVDHEVSVSVPVKSYNVSSLTVPMAKAILVGVMTTLILPITCLVVGFVIWFRRRKR